MDRSIIINNCIGEPFNLCKIDIDGSVKDIIQITPSPYVIELELINSYNLDNANIIFYSKPYIPPKKENNIYVVSKKIAAVLKGIRDDVFYCDGEIYNDYNEFIGYAKLSRY